MKISVLNAGFGMLGAAALLVSGCVVPETQGSPVRPVATVPVAAGVPVNPGSAEISVLSSRPEFVTGGDALVRVVASDGAQAGLLKVLVNGKAVQKPLAVSADGTTLQGVVSGLQVGPNQVQVTGPGGLSTSIEVVNYPATGPILSGPHLTPYECRTVESGLGNPTDANCSAPVRFDWFYRTTAGEFAPLSDPKARPGDLAQTTTIDGKTVPYIVRVESGVMNRAIYRLAVLDDPATEAFGVNEGWNGRLGVTFGGGAGTQYNQGENEVTSILNDLYLSRGFAFINSTELVNRQHANAVLQGETLMMLKEHFIESYGVPKWTVGNGGSGGAIQQLVITQIYPGLLDGLQPSLAYPDSTLHTADCGLIENFFRDGPGKTWSKTKKAAVEGLYVDTCGAWERSFVPVMFATNAAGCALNDARLLYHPTRNPKGARCTVQDMRANIYGRDPATGFARKPQDNVGLQYGLKALQDGVITVGEFITLNENIGGYDIDGFLVKRRVAGDPIAIRAAYASGLMNSMGGGLANVPILNFRWYTDEASDIHSRERDLTIRARLEKANGRSDNQVIWTAARGARVGRGNDGSTPAVDLSRIALDVMTEWLDTMAADPAPLSADKVVAHKPAAAVDAYWTPEGEMRAAVYDWNPESPLNKVYPIHLEPRLVAGAPIANDILKCQLRPIDWDEYKATFAPSQKRRLERAFPGGVCDWSKPGVEQVPLTGAYVKY